MLTSYYFKLPYFRFSWDYIRYTSILS